jgi:hypothetical protein
LLKHVFVVVALLALAACSSPPGLAPPSAAPASVTRVPAMGIAVAATANALPCQTRDNDSLAKVEDCIRESDLWRRLSRFQTIADENPGPKGHPNRNTGTSGYRASVAYVAGLMREAGYRVTIQPYVYTAPVLAGAPVLRTAGGAYLVDRDWYVARGSGSGSVSAPLQFAGSGCSKRDFAGFVRGDIALLAHDGSCSVDRQVRNAENGGAAAILLYNAGGPAYEPRLSQFAAIPVGMATSIVGAQLARRSRVTSAATVQIDVQMQRTSGLDYNLIAESPFGDASRTVVVDAHLDSIYGAGMLDNASGSTSALEVALALSRTPTRNRLRFIWFGGEELGLLGSHYYTRNLTPAELRRIAFDLDVDVTATPNFDIQVADPANAYNVKQFPPNVVPQSRAGNDLFYDYFSAAGVISRAAPFGNDGTDSNSFSLAGVPNTGILTEQDCCKQAWETRLWGGYLGNYEGQVPGFNGGCVDYPQRWCDNLSNNDPFVLTIVSKAVAAVVFRLANDPALPH